MRFSIATIVLNVSVCLAFTICLDGSKSSQTAAAAAVATTPAHVLPKRMTESSLLAANHPGTLSQRLRDDRLVPSGGYEPTLCGQIDGGLIRCYSTRSKRDETHASIANDNEVRPCTYASDGLSVACPPPMDRSFLEDSEMMGTSLANLGSVSLVSEEFYHRNCGLTLENRLDCFQYPSSRRNRLRKREQTDSCYRVDNGYIFCAYHRG